MYICISICIWVFIWIYMLVHTYMYLYIRAQSCMTCAQSTYIEPQVPACRYAPILRDIQKHIHTCISIRTYTATCLHPFTHTQTQTVLVTLTFAFTYINIHANRQPNKRRPNNLPTLLQIHACWHTHIHAGSFADWRAFLLAFARVRDTCILTNLHCSHAYELVLFHVHAWLGNILSQ